MNLWFSRLHPPSGAIPRFPMWEVTVSIFAIIAGFVGYFTPDSSAIVAILGHWSIVWNIILVVSGAGSLIGMAIPVPNGLIVHLSAMTLLAVSAGSVVVGLTVIQGNLFFSGSITLYVFAVGALARAIQIQYQLYRINKGLHLMSIKKEVDNDG